MFPEETPEGQAIIAAANEAISAIQERQRDIQRRMNLTYIQASADALRARYDATNQEITNVRTKMVHDLESIDMSHYPAEEDDAAKLAGQGGHTGEPEVQAGSPADGSAVDTGPAAGSDSPVAAPPAV